MELVSLLEKVKSWCESNNVVCFEGLPLEDHIQIEWLENDNISDYLDKMKMLNCNLITYHQIVFSIDLLIDYSKIDFAEKSDNIQISKSLKNLQKLEGELQYLGFYAITNGVIVYFGQDNRKVVEKVDELKELIDGSIQEIREEEEKEKNKLTEKEQKRIAKILATDLKYLTTSTRSQERKRYVKNKLSENGVLEDELGEQDLWYIKYFARDIYESKTRTVLEKRLKEQIEELKKAGEIKKAICSKLGITQGMLDKFYH